MKIFQKFFYLLAIAIFHTCLCGASEELTTEEVTTEEVTTEEVSIYPSLEVPIDYRNAEKGTFEFHYNLTKSGGETLPVVIYLPGGPPSSSLGTYHNKSSLLTFDQRGFGLNNKKSLQEQLALDANLISVELAAHDIYLTVKYLLQKGELKNYIILGVSYGTVLATILVNKIEEDDSLKLPDMVLLDGVVGYVSSQEYFFIDRMIFSMQSYISKWQANGDIEKIQRLLGAEIVDETFRKRILFLAYVAANSNSGWDDQLLEDESKFRDFFEKHKDSLDVSEKAAGNRGYLKILFKQCNLLDEILPCCSYHIDKELKISFKSEGKIADLLELKPDYIYHEGHNIKKSPVLYFNGDIDPRTPLTQALDHFNRQPTADKYFFKGVGKNHGLIDYDFIHSFYEKWDPDWKLKGKGICGFIDCFDFNLEEYEKS